MLENLIRSLTSLMAGRIRKFKSPLDDNQRDLKKIFYLRPFTRIIEWGRDFKNAFSYLTLNQLEGLGLVNRKTEKKRTYRSRPTKKNCD